MTTDFRALCAELVDNIHRGSSGMLGWTSEQEDELLARARAALAEPSDEELMALAITVFENPCATEKDYARAVLARWGRFQNY